MRDSVKYRSRKSVSVNLEDYVLLEAKETKYFGYPDLLIAMHRLSPLEVKGIIRKARQHYDITYGTQEGNDGKQYVDKISWAEGLFFNEKLHNDTMTMRHFIEFITLLKSGKAFDGRGNKIRKNILGGILDEILTPRRPLRGEWIDTYFEPTPSYVCITFNNKYRPEEYGRIMPEWVPLLDEYLMKEGYIDISSCSPIGLPTKKSIRKKSEIYYTPPKKDCAVVFMASSSPFNTGFYCNFPETFFASGVGIRAMVRKYK